jgi:sigma-B regulation protein RsbU (phosphoserine phosphatase)
VNLTAPANSLLNAVNSRLIAELRRTVAPVATLLDVSIGLLLTNGAGGDSSETLWLEPRKSHMTCSLTLPVAANTPEQVELIVFFAEGKEYVTTILPHLIEVALRNVALSEEEDSLLEELSSSWESLEAVYEMSSELRSIATPGDLLERIVSRAVALRDDMSAALWIQDGEELLPHSSANSEPLASKSPTQGLVASAIGSRRAIVINENLAAVAGADPELAGARSFALAPIATRQGLVGALEVWSRDANTRFDSHTINLIQALALQAAMVIENDRLHKATIEAERLQQEIEIGSKIQEVLLLGQLPEPVAGLSIAAYTLASRQIDGDFYEFFRQRGDCLDIVIGDVMGKGIPAALIGAATKSHLSHALNRLLASSQGGIPEPQQIINAAHTQVTPQLIDCESFTTLCLARFDVGNHLLTFVDCGHTQTIRCRPSGEIELLRGVNMPLGFSEKEVYEQTTLSFEAGDVFLFYSDGLTEAKGPNDELFGEERLAECVRASSQSGPSQVIEQVRAGVIAFAGSEVFSDDLTCVAVKIDGPSVVWLDNNRAELTTTSSFQELERIRNFIHRICAGIPGLSESDGTTDALVLAVNEAATNVMRHAYQGRADGGLHFVAELQPEALVLSIFHHGLGFDRAGVTQPEFDRTREGGFGLFIIEQCFDEVVYYTEPQGRHCTRLTKTIKTKE